MTSSAMPAPPKGLPPLPVDLVCLYILLGPQPSFAVADVRAEGGIPFVFVTACDPGIVPERHRRQLLVDKDDIPYLLVPACRAAMAPPPPPPGGASLPPPHHAVARD